jgi:thioredoxin 1
MLAERPHFPGRGPALAGQAEDRLPFAHGPPARAVRSGRSPHPEGRYRNEDPTTMSSELIKHVSDTSFDADVLKSQNPVLVDFWAEWCGPCKMFAPILDEAAREYQGRLTVAKLDIDHNQATPAKYGIRGIPTLILYKDGQAHAQKVGAMSKSQLKAFLDSNL